jgi:hypothetical protein
MVSCEGLLVGVEEVTALGDHHGAPQLPRITLDLPRGVATGQRADDITDGLGT